VRHLTGGLAPPESNSTTDPRRGRGGDGTTPMSPSARERLHGGSCLPDRSRAGLRGVAPGAGAAAGAPRPFKGVELRDTTPPDPEALYPQLHPAIGRLRQEPDVVRRFLAGAGLPCRKLQAVARRPVSCPSGMARCAERREGRVPKVRRRALL